MALNVLNFRALWTGCSTLTLLFLVTGIEGNIIDNIYYAVGRCPVSKEGFFIAPGTGQAQCFRVMDLTEKVVYGQAEIKCGSVKDDPDLGFEMTLARPYNAQALSEYLFERYSKPSFWMAGKGDGSSITWRNTSPFEEMSNNNPLYGTSKPVNPSFNDCLVLRTDGINHETPYTTENCNADGYTLCEVVGYNLLHDV